MVDTDPRLIAAHLENERRYQRAAGRFQYSWMSDTKWRKVFKAIAESGTNVTRCEYKCIDSDHVWQNRVPRLQDVEERCFADGAYQPFEYKWIEWFRFPRRYKPYKGIGYVVEQDVEALKTAIEAAAQARLELDDEYLWLYGYSGQTPGGRP